MNLTAIPVHLTAIPVNLTAIPVLESPLDSVDSFLDSVDSSFNHLLPPLDSLRRKAFLQLPAEGSVQQRLFQLVERGELPLVEGFEALGFFGQSLKLVYNPRLLAE